MAKVKAPLMSFDARGQIAKSLVYMGWKGLKTVRQYVIPANPKSTLQQAQRTKFATAVGQWHTDGFTSDDASAWNLLALSLKEALSGFNIYIRLKLKALIKAVTWNPIFDVTIGTIIATGAHVLATGEGELSYTVYYGVSKTAMFNTEDGDAIAGVIDIELTGLVASTKYYCYIKEVTATESARTGIYSFETIAA